MAFQDTIKRLIYQFTSTGAEQVVRRWTALVRPLVQGDERRVGRRGRPKRSNKRVDAIQVASDARPRLRMLPQRRSRFIL